MSSTLGPANRFSAVAPVEFGDELSWERIWTLSRWAWAFDGFGRVDAGARIRVHLHPLEGWLCETLLILEYTWV